MAKKLDELTYELLKEVRLDVKDVKKEIVDVKITNVEQNSQLQEHMRRTELAEKRLDAHDDDIKELQPKPKTPVNWKKNITWGLGIITGLCAVGGFAGRMLGWF